ncbi:hypothetical protein GobsT_02360 [Gemmata obscuriglobus]|uniref:Uncharacterized protein n=2 Tax=Gemmata obscuriglobus TaxID=114 RepID=A0A2Z3HH84_9BACT|nr:hypothetical protein C1280_31970 [Gemmata obscuriglobus]QEG25510.1 hypothetical protein GobsT_02360 [Gemmata obscuriglobus]VTR98797.1 Uncharacterized protein OS=Flavobacterium enshiense DK69 GN=FEDK69T_17720 PE=4 SV=1 [Gemmata obscuriglobus UQM 2246]
MDAPNTRPVEGIDYYVENGKWVFTAAYHRKRGHCCKSGCRHCPFGNAPSDRTAEEAQRPAQPKS